jgi:cellulase/cellobiase CelA1
MRSYRPGYRPGRALGRRPTLDPGPAGIAAYLWIKDPGVSDGPCNGGPPAGGYWPQYALSLVRHALAEARAGRRPALSWVLSGPRWETK